LVAPLQGKRAIERLTREFQEYFGVKHLFWVTSGKAALTLILLGLKRLSPRRRVVIPAYTCFSVPSSVVKAELEIGLCDVDPLTLDFDMAALRTALGEDALAVVPTHLLGCRADVAKAAEYARSRQVYVIEDVAQAFGGMSAGRPLGTGGDVAFLSFGRGKNITCGSGGVIMTDSDCIADAIRVDHQRLEPESFAGAMKNWCEVAAMSLLVNPASYWFPSGLPFLKLGETKFYRDFPMVKMDAVRAGLLSNWRTRLSRSTTVRSDRAFRLAERLSEAHGHRMAPQFHHGSVHLRLPLLLETIAEKTRLCALSKERGLGISPLYPATVQQIPELQSTLAAAHVSGAAILAERLVTLPTHNYMTDHDMTRIVAAVEAAHRGKDAVEDPLLEQKVTFPC
jgi:dTDP-4-amino-4,6-dideoxygalactose transaminase